MFRKFSLSAANGIKTKFLKYSQASLPNTVNHFWFLKNSTYTQKCVFTSYIGPILKSNFYLCLQGSWNVVSQEDCDEKGLRLGPVARTTTNSECQQRGTRASKFFKLKPELPLSKTIINTVHPMREKNAEVAFERIRATFWHEGHLFFFAQETLNSPASWWGVSGWVLNRKTESKVHWWCKAWHISVHSSHKQTRLHILLDQIK